MNGAIYVIGSDIYKKNIYKIGFTTTNKNLLITRYRTSLGHPIIHFYIQCRNPRQHESEIHRLLDKYRIYSDRELFKCRISIIKYNLSLVDNTFYNFNIIKRKMMTLNYKISVLLQKIL